VLDAEITSCASALICRSMRVDGRMEKRLTDISAVLASKQADAGEPAAAAAYYARLNELISAVLVESRSGQA
jgi:hypothetical protein